MYNKHKAVSRINKALFQNNNLLIIYHVLVLIFEKLAANKNNTVLKFTEEKFSSILW